MVNKICFTLCLICIIVGTTISILAIWKVIADQDFYWRSLMTLGVLFLASVLTATINNFIPITKDK